MMSYLDGDIIPEEGVGKLRLGWRLEEVKNHIEFVYKIIETPHGKLLEADSIRLFFTKDEKLHQITVYDNYRGKLFKRVGIGGKIEEIREFTDYKLEEESNDFDFYLPKYRGVFLHLEGWDDETTPITHISICSVNENAEN